MSLINVYHTDNPAWDLSLKELLGENYEFHYSSSYHSLFEEKDIKEAKLFIYIDRLSFFLIPFVRRKIDDNFYDATSTFGYTGFKTNNTSKDFLIKANDCYIDYLKQNNIIAELIRFSPFNDITSIAKDLTIKIDAVKPYLVNSLKMTQDELLARISPRIRTYIRKAEKKIGDKTYITKDSSLVEEFVRLYINHMSEKGVSDYYLFNDIYYKKLINIVKQSGFLVCVIDNNKITSGLIFIQNNDYSYYHHGARNFNFIESDLANKYLFWVAFKHLQSIGCKYCLLGGGVKNDKDDSLFRFKKKFGGEERMFYIGKRIVLPDEYERICGKWESQHPELVSKYGNYIDKYMFTC